MKYFLELMFRAGFRPVSRRAVERGGKRWQTADAVHLCSHCPVGLGEADPRSLGSERPTLKAYPCHILLVQCREIIHAANALDRSVVHVMQHLDGGMPVSSGHRFHLTPSTSDAETRPRPTCARLSTHANFVAILLLSPENGL